MKEINFFERYRKECEKCNHAKEVIIPSNDPENGQLGNEIDILFVNERPGPTAIKTGFISFDNPDESARRFKRIFKNVFGLDYRKKIFITNAVLWCPKVENYKNQTPTPEEVKCGSKILSKQIIVIKPKIIVTIGLPALHALHFCFMDNVALEQAMNKRLRDVVGIPLIEKSYKIIPLFHTSPRNIPNRSESDQMTDWRKMATNI